MNFELSEEQRLLADSVRRFIAQDYTFEKRKAIVGSELGYSPAIWKTIADLGLLALPIPTEHGGFGGTAVDLMPVMEAFGEALVVEPYLSTVMCAQMLGRSLEGGNPARSAQAGILSAVAEGSMKLALAQIEDGARYDSNHVATAAKRDGDGFVLNGVKRVVLHAPQADRLLVSARTSGATTDERGLSLFIVDPNAPGIRMTPYRTIDEMRGADVALNNVRVSGDALIGRIDEGFIVLEEGLEYGTALLCAEAVGAMKFANDTTLEYLKARRQFGVPIGSFQALQHRMVDMVIEAEQARSMASMACAASRGDARTRRRTVAAAKLRIAQACARVSQESVQLHGGMGMTEELKVSHAFRRLTALRQQHGDDVASLERYTSGS